MGNGGQEKKQERKQQKPLLRDVRSSLEAHGVSRESQDWMVDQLGIFLIREEALSLQGEIRRKAEALEEMVLVLADILAEEAVLDVSLETGEQISLGGVEDSLLLDLRGVSAGGAESLLFTWRTAHPQAAPEPGSGEFSGRGPGRRLDGLDRRPEGSGAYRDLLRLEVTTRKPARRRFPLQLFRPAGREERGLTVYLNRGWLEGRDRGGPIDLDTSYRSLSSFVDALSDHYQSGGYRLLVRLLNGLPSLLRDYFQGKEAMLRDMSWEG